MRGGRGGRVPALLRQPGQPAVPAGCGTPLLRSFETTVVQKLTQNYSWQRRDAVFFVRLMILGRFKHLFW